MINVRGFKVAPTEVEDAALRFEKLADCACIPYDDKALGRCLKMFVVMKEGCPFDAKEITAFLDQMLEPYKLPRFIECLPEIPRTYNGKVDRKKLIGMQ